MRRHGLVVDNLVSAEVVLADGRVVRASENDHPDLFWALRGGGGNFGVVTEFEYRLHPVGPEVHLGFFFWPLEQAATALRVGRDVTDGLSRDAVGFLVALSAPPAPFVPEQHHGVPGAAFVVVGFGTADEHAAAVAPVREARPLVEYLTPIPYVALQQMFDDHFAWGVLAYTKGLYFDKLGDEVIDVIVEQLPGRTSLLTAMPLFLPGGAFAEVPDDATAFGGRRSTRVMLVIDAIAADAGVLDADRTWARRTCEALRPLAAGDASYVNAMYEDDPNRIRATFGPKYERLAQIKAEYDPGNVFHRNINIKPA
jgi:FAD/FMN-containing dehydrogenase